MGDFDFLGQAKPTKPTATPTRQPMHSAPIAKEQIAARLNQLHPEARGTVGLSQLLFGLGLAMCGFAAANWLFGVSLGWVFFCGVIGAIAVVGATLLAALVTVVDVLHKILAVLKKDA